MAGNPDMFIAWEQYKRLTGYSEGFLREVFFAGVAWGSLQALANQTAALKLIAAENAKGKAK